MDRLEEFIAAHREEFDHAVPSLKVWARLDKALDQQPRRRIHLWRTLQIAASVLVLLTVGGIGGLYLARQGQPVAAQTVAAIAPELAEAERYYNEQFNEKYKLLASYPHDKELETDLTQIDQAMNELKNELLNVPKGSEEEVIRNLVQSYQLKLQILEQVLDRLQAVQSKKQAKTKDNEIGM